MKALEWAQDFSNCKSKGMFPDFQGQVTLHSLVGSGRILNSFEILWLSSLPARIKKIQSKMKALDWPQHYNYDISDARRQLTSLPVVGSG